ALDAAGVPAPSAKPAPGSPAPAVKPAAIPASKPASASAAKPVTAQAAKPAPAATAKPSSDSSKRNQLQRVNVVKAGDGVRVEIISNQPVTARVSKLNSPARVLVELPETVLASSQNHVSFDG